MSRNSCYLLLDFLGTKVLKSLHYSAKINPDETISLLPLYVYISLLSNSFFDVFEIHFSLWLEIISTAQN